MIQNEGTDVASALEDVKSDADSAIQSYNDRVS